MTAIDSVAGIKEVLVDTNTDLSRKEKRLLSDTTAEDYAKFKDDIGKEAFLIGTGTTAMKLKDEIMPKLTITGKIVKVDTTDISADKEMQAWIQIFLMANGYYKGTKITGDVSDDLTSAAIAEYIKANPITVTNTLTNTNAVNTFTTVTYLNKKDDFLDEAVTAT